jgi:hypothetical protein
MLEPLLLEPLLLEFGLVVLEPLLLEPEPLMLEPLLVGGSPGQVGPRWMCISWRVSGSSPVALTSIVRLSPETARDAVPATWEPFAGLNVPLNALPPAVLVPPAAGVPVAVVPVDEVLVGDWAWTAEAMSTAPTAAGAASASRRRAAWFFECIVSVPFR